MWRAEHAVNLLHQLLFRGKRNRDELIELVAFLHDRYDNTPDKRPIYLQVPLDRCARCKESTNAPSKCTTVVEGAIGGKFDGVVCPYHMICHDCWWFPDSEQSLLCASYKKGARAHEAPDTVDVPLSKNPFENKCPGCRQNMEMHVEKARELYAIDLANKQREVIDLSDDDTKTEAAEVVSPIELVLTKDEHPIHLVVRKADGTEMHVVMSQDGTFSDVFENEAVLAFAGSMKIQLSIDGDAIPSDSTPRDHAMEDDDIIEMTHMDPP